MADMSHATDGPSPLSKEGYDESRLPDFNKQFVAEADLESFALALSAPEPSQSTEDLTATNGLNSPFAASRTSLQGQTSPLPAQRSSFDATRPKSIKTASSQQGLFITAKNDWAPVNKRVKSSRKKRRRPALPRRKDETREGYLYTLLSWPLLFIVLLWVGGLGMSYLWTRLYIWLYEHFVAWRGKRNRIRRKLEATTNYADWVDAAKELDTFLGNDAWKNEAEYAYYDHKTVKRVLDQIRRLRRKAEADELSPVVANGTKTRPIEELMNLIEACVKNNFVGVENARLYSQTYYGTKSLVQEFIDEVEKSVTLLTTTTKLSHEEKRMAFKHMHTNFGRTALCLSGGATFAYYHFGVVKALLDANLLPDVITGTSGGALIAALVATRTNDELKALLVPALAGKINACSEPMTTWIPRWWKTGARFDSIDWARRCSWFTRGSMTFREAYERTGRILNVSCVPADPHSPTLLLNYLTSPDCVIWSAVIASAAVPGILNPVVLMTKSHSNSVLTPYSFGHKWKDGSLRTDIPIKALNLHFNVNFSIVSQVNPHINLFFFSSRGSVGHPVTHRRGRGWRGGFIGSATEQYLKLDLTKWLKVVRHLELLPRPLGQDWSEIWLQTFSGTITIWPRSRLSDFWHILSDPDPPRLAHMLHVGQQSAFPTLKFLANRIKVERAIEKGRAATRPGVRRGSIESVWSADDLRGLLVGSSGNGVATTTEDESEEEEESGTGDEFEEAVMEHEREMESGAVIVENDGDGDGDGGGGVDGDEEAVLMDAGVEMRKRLRRL